jgi:hypothetical protein
MKKIKYLFSLIGISFILFSFSNCGSSKSMDTKYQLSENPPFVISDIYSQKWVAGTIEGGSGTHVQITFENINDGVEINDIYFRENITKAKLSSTKNKYLGTFSQTLKEGDILPSDCVQEAKINPPKKVPFQLANNDIVISYMNNTNLEYFKIENIEEKPMLSYPQGNPNNKY